MCQPSPYHPTELACGWESAMTTIEGRGGGKVGLWEECVVWNSMVSLVFAKCGL